MINERTLNLFSSKVDHAYQQFCVWIYANNEFIKHAGEWNKPFKQGEEFSKWRGRIFKNFWHVIIPSLQHSWILSIARLVDPPYFDKNSKSKPNLSIYYITEQLKDDNLKREIINELIGQTIFTESIKKQRNKFLAHNCLNFSDEKIEAGLETFFQKLTQIIKSIKDKYPELKNCKDVNLIKIKELSKIGVEEIFEKIIN